MKMKMMKNFRSSFAFIRDVEDRRRLLIPLRNWFLCTTRELAELGMQLPVVFRGTGSFRCNPSFAL
jgi:hypothetical protein